jgi:copper transport protein
MQVRIRIAILVAIVCAIALTLRTPDHASAHAFLDHSDPAANAIVPNAPGEVELWFTERLEPESTSASLVDHLGNTIPGTSFRIGDAKQLIVTLPADLGKGTYSVVWKNISADDGHPANGYLPFTIGSAADIQQIMIPVAATETAGASEWLRAGSRWLAFIGLFLVTSLWPIWSFVLQPAMRRTPGAFRAIRPVLQRIAIFAFAAAVIGNIAALLVQAAEPGGSYSSALRTTLFSTRYGDLWLARMAGLAVLAVLLSVASWARPWRKRWIGFAALLVSGALVVPFSLNSHANAQTTGRTFAITADVAHLIAAAFWGGGAIVLLIALWSIRTRLPEGGMRQLLVIAIPRFSFLALAAWVMLAATGSYAAWLEVASLDGALDTTYGNAFLVKMALAVVLLGFGATHLLVVTRKIRTVLNGDRWSRRFLITLSAEVVAIVAILLVTGWLTSEPPAREVLAQEDAAAVIQLSANSLDGTLTITPGTAGPNHIRLQLNGGDAPADAEGLLRLTASDVAFGTQEIALTPVGGNAWETHGSQFSLVGDWSVTAIVRKIGEFQWQAVGDALIKPASDGATGSSEPWRFNMSALTGLALLLIGAICVGWAVTVGKSNSRKEASGIAAAALVVGVLLLIQGRIEAPASIDTTIADDATLARGAAIYTAQCLACHGVSGKGDGPAAVNMPVQPANFTDPSHLIHSTSTMESYVTNGFPNTGMPAFGGTLSEQEIADVVAYIRAFALNSSATVQIPDAPECTVAPRDPQTLMQSTPPVSSVATIDLGPETIEWPQGNPASNDDVTAITTTVRQFIACSNADDYGRALALSTVNYLEPQFAELDAAARQSAIARAATPGTPLAEGAQLGIESIKNVEELDDGRIGAEVTTVDPINHPHTTTVVLIFAHEDGMWKIDEVRSLANTATPAATGTPSITTWPLTATANGYQIELFISSGPDDARPVRVTLRDSEGNAINDATIAVYFTPHSVGIPENIALTNSDPATYTGKVPLPETGTIDASVEITLADGTQLENVFTFTP